MLMNTWSIALLICSAGVLFLTGTAFFTAVQVLFYWDGSSDSESQIELEGKTWLAAALVQNGLAVQILSLFLLVMAAGDFSAMIAGAMCATGTFLANEYGIIILSLKIAGIFLYGFWILLHRFDCCSEYYPLIKVKFGYLLFLIPLILSDCYYLIQYLYNLSPDIITSCCGVIFSDKAVQHNFLQLPASDGPWVTLFYLCAILLFCLSFLVYNSFRRSGMAPASIFSLSLAMVWIIFFLMSLATITTYFSSYIYAMPFHNCPFDMLQKEYGYIGLPIYLSLFGASFLGVSIGVAALVRNGAGLSSAVADYQNKAVKYSGILLFIYVVQITYPVISYVTAGGEL